MTRERRIQATVLVLGLILVAFSLIGRRNAAWPIFLWEMYSLDSDRYPPPTFSVVQLRVTDDNGQLHRLSASDLLAPDQHKLPQQAVEGAFAGQDLATQARYRRFLAVVAEQAVGTSELRCLEAWRLTWEVDPLAVPPLVREEPAQEQLVGRFAPRAGESAAYASPCPTAP